MSFRIEEKLYIIRENLIQFKEFLIKNIQELILHKNHDEQTKIMLTLSVLMSCLGDYLNQEDSITPRCISETKKICLLYLSN